MRISSHRLHILLSCVLSCAIVWSCSKSNDQIQPQRRKIVEAVYASGTIHPLNEYKAYSNATGILRNLHFREGDTVHAEQVLYEVEARDPQLRVQSARDAFDYAKTNANEHSAALDELRANVEAAHAKYVNDSLVMQRTRSVLASGATTQLEMDRVNSNFESSRALWIAADKRLSSTRQSLSNQLKFAQRQFDLANTTQNNFAVQSRFDGRVYALYREEGEMVTTSQPVALLGDANIFILRLVIDASDVARVKPGQKVLYTVDAFPDSSFTATVMKVFPVLDNETQSFRVDASCDRRPLVPFVGTQLQANIVVSEKENALVIPRAFLQPNNQVFVKDGSSVKTQTVQVGISNLESVEILAGIDEKTIIVRKR